MTALADFTRYLAECPLIAIIRGVRPDEAEAVCGAIIDAGIRIVEVPLNSPDPFASIERLAKRFGDQALIGGGTVLDPDDVKRVARAGGRIIVSPSTDAAVIRETWEEGLVSAPGFFTPSEGFAALKAGAHVLKLFPAEAASPAVLKAIKAVLPHEVPLIVVGGVKPDTMRPWLEVGASGFGLGSGLFKSGRSASEVAAAARAYVEGVRA
jgi:2-dehydro-3-deoxyphosphogalactonate aldolase